jgi:hypothetical protein
VRGGPGDTGGGIDIDGGVGANGGGGVDIDGGGGGAGLDGVVRIGKFTGNVLLSRVGGALSFFGNAAAVRPTITGSRGANAALASLLTEGDTLGLWTDSTVV